MPVDEKDFCDYGREYEYATVKSKFKKLQDKFYNIIDVPVTWIRENIVVPNRKEYNWYHRQYPRVPTIDQCYEDDPACIYEADEQFRRDYKVDARIIVIMKKRYENCVNFQGEDDTDKCEHLHKIWEQAVVNWFIKYGELGILHKSLGCYMKQKHRMIWERRYGPVGSGMNPIDHDKVEEEIKKCQ